MKTKRETFFSGSRCSGSNAPAIQTDLPEANYRQRPFVSASQLKTFHLKSPRHFEHQYLKTPAIVKEQTDAMLLGSLVHAYLLEPDTVSARYQKKLTPEDCPHGLVSAEDYKNACKAAGLKISGTKEDLKQRLQSHLGDQCPLFFEDALNQQRNLCCENQCEMVSPSLWLQAKAVVSAFYLMPHVAALIDHGRPEVSCFAHHESTQLPIKCRADWLRDDGIVVDVKTANSAAPYEFRRQFWKLGYHLQQALYTDCLRQVGIEVKAFVFLVIETEAPFCVQMYCMDEQSIEQSMAIYHQAMEKLARCLARDQWPAYSEDILLLIMPRWIGNDNTFNSGDAA